MFEYYYFNFNIYSFIQENKRKRETENKQEAQLRTQKQSLVWKICCCETLTIFSEANELFTHFPLFRSPTPTFIIKIKRFED